MIEGVLSLKKDAQEAEKRITMDDNAICIHVKPLYDYYIYLSDCETVAGALRWVEHIRQKTWMTDVMPARVIELMIQHNEARLCAAS